MKRYVTIRRRTHERAQYELVDLIDAGLSTPVELYRQPTVSSHYCREHPSGHAPRTAAVMWRFTIK